MNEWLSFNVSWTQGIFTLIIPCCDPFFFFFNYGLAYLFYVAFNLGNIQTYTIMTTFISFLPPQTPIILKQIPETILSFQNM